MKELKDITYTFEPNMLTVEMTFEDDSKHYIFVQVGMIFVADCNYTELSKRIESGDTDSFESYDTIDGCDYYASSDYASEINCALLKIANNYL